jgi:hypothetical protein
MFHVKRFLVQGNKSRIVADAMAVLDRPFSGLFQGDTLQTQAPNHPHRCAMLSRQPVRLSGGRQGFAARWVGYGEMSRTKVRSG